MAGLKENTISIQRSIEGSIQEGDKGFHKVFMENFLPVMGPISNKKSQVVFWVIDHLSKNNEFKYTYREIARKTNISYQTVAITMRALIDADFLRKSGKVLILNPNIIFKGRYKSRRYVQTMFDEQRSDTELRLYYLRERLNRLESEAQSIRNEIKELTT